MIQLTSEPVLVCPELLGRGRLVAVAADTARWIPDRDAAELLADTHIDEGRSRTDPALLLVAKAVFAMTGACPDWIHQRCTICGGQGHGRPRASSGMTEVSVSWTRSADVVVAAASSIRRVGVDVELHEHLALLSDGEARSVFAVIPDELAPNRNARLAEEWTLREALFKAGVLPLDVLAGRGRTGWHDSELLHASTAARATGTDFGGRRWALALVEGEPLKNTIDAAGLS